MKKIINTTNAPAPVGPYNQAILIDDTLYVSGQIALDPVSMIMIEGSIEEEAKKVMQNIKAILQEVDFSFENIIVFKMGKILIKESTKQRANIKFNQYFT